MTAPTTPRRHLHRSARPAGSPPYQPGDNVIRLAVNHHNFPADVAAVAERMYRGEAPENGDLGLTNPSPTICFQGNEYPVSFFARGKDDHGIRMTWDWFVPVPEWSKYFAEHVASDAVSEHDIQEAISWIVDTYAEFGCVSRYPFELWGRFGRLPVVVVVTFLVTFRDDDTQVAVLVRDRSTTDQVWAARCALLDMVADDLGIEAYAIDFDHAWGGDMP